MTYEKGQSGNPAGRRLGSRNKATILAETMFQGEAETIIGLAIDKAKKGDITAIRLCLERVFPRLRIGVKMLVSFFDSTFGAVVHRCCARAWRGIDAGAPASAAG